MDVFELWESVLNAVKEQDPQYYGMFSSQIFPISFQGNILTLTVVKPYLAGWIYNVYGKRLEEILYSLTEAGIEIQVKENSAPSPASFSPERAAHVEESPSPYGHEKKEEIKKSAPFSPFPEDIQKSDDAALPLDLTNIRPMRPEEVNLPSLKEVIGNPQPTLFSQPGTQQTSANRESMNYTFDNFVYGMPNQMAYTAAHAIAESVCKNKYDKQFNPLFIYGPPGLGKTHLLRAIQNYVAVHAPNKKVLFKGTLDFTGEVVAAIKNSKTEELRKNYQTVDVLLLDDVQLLGGKESTSTEWFSTFNILFEHQKNIIMTSDRTPEDIEKLEERLKSRFAGGLVAQILQPDYEMCCIILQKKAEEDRIAMPTEVINFISSHINKNVRVLEGAYNKVKLYCEMMKLPITIETAQQSLQDDPSIKKSSEITVDRIIDTVCLHYGVSRAKILGAGRPKKIVVPRQIAMYLCRHELGESFPSLAHIFNKKDHTSVMYACTKVEQALEKDALLKQTVSQLEELLKKG